MNPRPSERQSLLTNQRARNLTVIGNTVASQICLDLKKRKFKKLISPVGPFTDINAEEVEEEISSMYRTVFKLSKTFGDVPAPRRVADSVKSKIDKFKVHLPLLQVICNPGLRDRHWEQVSRLQQADSASGRVSSCTSKAI